MPLPPRNIGQYAPTSPAGGAAAAPTPSPAVVASTPLKSTKKDQSPFLPVISPHKFEVSPDKVVEQLFGRTLQVDPVTGVCTNILQEKPLAPIRHPGPAPEPDVSAVFQKLFGRPL